MIPQLMSCRRALRLESELKAQQQRCAALQADKKQAEAATAGSEIQQQKQAQDMAALRKELTALQATLATVQQQQQVAAAPCLTALPVQAIEAWLLAVCRDNQPL